MLKRNLSVLKIGIHRDIFSTTGIWIKRRSVSLDFSNFCHVTKWRKEIARQSSLLNHQTDGTDSLTTHTFSQFPEGNAPLNANLSRRKQKPTSTTVKVDAPRIKMRILFHQSKLSTIFHRHSYAVLLCARACRQSTKRANSDRILWHRAQERQAVRLVA